MVARFIYTLSFVALTGAGSLAFGQNAVRGFPEATRVYYNGNTMAAPSYGGYAPAPYQAGYLPATGVTAYYPGAMQPPTTAYYAAQPVTAAPAPVITAPPGSRFETQAYPPSPFYRAPSNYVPPNYVYRPGAQPTAVTYYRPVTVYDPVTGAPATYMSACTGTECRGAPQRSYYGSMFQQPKACGSCAGGSCATGQCAAPAQPYYPTTPPVVVQPQVVPQVVPTVPSAPPIMTGPPITTAPPAAVYPTYPNPAPTYPAPTLQPGPFVPSAQPPLNRSTIPPPGTVFPQTQPFGMPGGTGIGPVDPRANVTPNLGPGNFQPAVPGGGSYAPQTDAKLDPKLGQPTRVEPGKNGEPPTYYYYRGSSNAAATQQQQAPQQQAQPIQQQPMQQQPLQPQYHGPALNTPLKNPQPSGDQSSVIPPLNGFGAGPIQSPAQPEPFRFRPSGIDSPSTTPQPPLQFPVHPEVKPLPDPEPRPVNRAPQLLNPKDKTAMRP